MGRARVVGPVPPSCGHLLRGAVDAAAKLAQDVYVQGDDLAAGIVAGEGVDGDGVGFRVAKFSGDDGTVAGVGLTAITDLWIEFDR